MTIEGILVVLLLISALLVLVFTRVAADAVFTGVLTLIIISGIIPAADAIDGFSNEGMLTVAALYVVAAGLRETGAIQFVINNLLGIFK